MLATLAIASLIRHRTRTVLAILGVAVSAAMLLDMVMLSSGMRESFRGLLLSQGFQLRLSPRGAAITASALGVEPSVQGDYELVAGRQPTAPNEIVANDAMLRAIGRSLGDTLRAA